MQIGASESAVYPLVCSAVAVVVAADERDIEILDVRLHAFHLKDDLQCTRIGISVNRVLEPGLVILDPYYMLRVASAAWSRGRGNRCALYLAMIH